MADAFIRPKHDSICNHAAYRTCCTRINTAPAVRSHLITILMLIATCFAWTGHATAAALYWSGSNTWDNGSVTDWGTSSAGPYNVSAWVGGSDAHFLGTPGAVSVSGSIASVQSISFDAGGYTLSNGSVNLTASGGSINVVAGGGATINSVVTGTVGLTLAGGGALTLGAANTYSGTTTLTAGTLTLHGTTASPTFSIASGAVLELNGAISNPANTVFSGGGTLRKTGAGQVVWGASAATFQLAAGSLIDVQSGTFVGGSSANEVWTNNLSGLNVAAGATFNGVEANVIVDALTGGGTISSGFLGAGYVQFTYGVNGGSGTFGGVLADGAASGSFVKSGSGAQTLTGINTYTGATSVNGGTLQIGNGGSGASIGSTSSVLDNSALVFNHADTVTFLPSISGSGSLTQTGGGKLILASSNSFSGVTNILAGALQISDANSLQNSTVNQQTDSGLEFGPAIGLFVVGGLSGANNLVLSDRLGNPIVLTVGGNNASTTFAGTINGNGNLDKVGTGSLTLSGVSMFGLGLVSVDGGTISLPSGRLSPPSLYVGNSNAGSFAQSGGTVSPAGYLYVGYNTGAQGSYVFSGTGLLTATSEYIGYNGTGSFTQSGGTNVVAIGSGLSVGYDAGGSGSYNLSGGSLVCGGFLAVGLNGTGVFTQSGGTLTTSQFYIGFESSAAGSTYSLSGGSLYCGQPEYVGYAGSASFVQSGGTNTIAGSLTIGLGAGVAGNYNLSGGLLDLKGLAAGSGSAVFDFSGGTLQALSSFSTSVPIALGAAGTSVFDTGGNTLTLSAPLSGGNGVTKTGAGLLVLAATGSYTGGTTVSAGTLQLLADKSSPSFTVASSATLLLSSGTFNLNNRYVQALSGGSAVYKNSTIIGGFLRGPGSHVLSVGATNSLNYTTLNIGSALSAARPRRLHRGYQPRPTHQHRALDLERRSQRRRRGVTILNSATVTEWSNAGIVVVGAGGALNNYNTDLTSYGGGRITVNSGGTLNADSQNSGQALDLQDSLLVNNGSVPGTTNVYYGATVQGSGTFGQINVFDGGTLATSPSAAPIAAGIMVSSGSVTGGGAVASPAVVFNATFVTPLPTDVLVLSGSLTGAGPITKSGPGELILSGSNSFGGGVVVTDGKLDVASPAALADGSNLTIGAASIFDAPVPPPAGAMPVPEPSAAVLLGAALCLAAVGKSALRCPLWKARTI